LDKEANMLVEVVEPSVLRMPELSDDAFFDFCTSNEEYRIERTAEGRVVVMPGTGGETGIRNALLIAQITNWSLSNDRGYPIDSSTMFRLANSAIRSPDGGWISRTRLARMSAEVRKKFLTEVPEFVVELISPSDRLREVQAKMDEWTSNGVETGWIIDPERRQVHIYRAGSSVEIIDQPATVSGDGSISGLTIDLTRIWNPGF
jgi:Uma2 family endonuclease